MMRENKTSYKVIKIIVCCIIAAVIVVTVALKFNLVKIPEYVRIILGLNSYENEKQSVLSNEIPNILSITENNQDIFLEIDDKELLELLHESTAYSRVVKIINSYGTERRVTKYTIKKNGNKFYIKSKSKLTVCDGEKIYVNSPEINFTSSARESNIYDEVGIISLSELKTLINNEESKLTSSENKKFLRAEIYDAEGNVISEYDISTEYGVVISEYHYKKGEIYRAAVTDSITDFNDDNKIFEILE